MAGLVYGTVLLRFKSFSIMLFCNLLKDFRLQISGGSSILVWGETGRVFLFGRLRRYCSAIRQVLGFHILHSFLCSAILFSSAYDDSFRNSFSIPNRFLPLGLFPIIRPSITSLRRLSPLSI